MSSKEVTLGPWATAVRRESKYRAAPKNKMKQFLNWPGTCSVITSLHISDKVILLALQNNDYLILPRPHIFGLVQSGLRSIIHTATEWVFRGIEMYWYIPVKFWRIECDDIHKVTRTGVKTGHSFGGYFFGILWSTPRRSQGFNESDVSSLVHTASAFK